MAEPIDRSRMMDVEDCASISRVISAILDVYDPIPGTYTLEVTSPGIDRPLVKLDDFRRYIGHLAKVELISDLNNRKRFKATIVGVDGNDILIDEDGALTRLPFLAIQKARLMLTDVLIRSVETAQMARRQVAPASAEEIV